MTTDTPRTDDQFRDATKMVPDQKPARIPKQKKCTFCGGAGWWLDAMGTNSYRCDKCQNPEKADHIVDANKMVPTPRTDAARERYYDGKTSDWVHYTIAMMLERELKASRAEVARLQKELDATCNAEELRQERETRKRAETEVERLTDRMKKAEDLIKGLHDGWKKARKAHLETCKNAQTEIDRLYGTNVCLQESEAGWKTEADKADQRRLEAEAEVERLRSVLQNLTDAVTKRLSDDFQPEAARQLWAAFKTASETLDQPPQ